MTPRSPARRARCCWDHGSVCASRTRLSSTEQVTFSSFPDEPLELGRTLELNDHKVTIVGISDASAPFVSWPVMHTRYSAAVNFVGRERSQLSYVLVKPQPGISALELCRRIEAQTGLRARTSEQFQWDCIGYYLKHTGIPVNFGITIMIALIVGIVVAGQTFYLFTVENLKQFAAIKAIGVTNWQLVRHDFASGPDRWHHRLFIRHGDGSRVFRFLRTTDRHSRDHPHVAERGPDGQLHRPGHDPGQHPEFAPCPRPRTRDRL